MKPSEIIDKAITEVIPDEDHWCQHDLAIIGGGSNGQDQYCSIGALRKAAYGNAYDYGHLDENGVGRDSQEFLTAQITMQKLIGALNPEAWNQYSIAGYNDSHVFEEVRVLFEKARAQLQEKGQ